MMAAKPISLILLSMEKLPVIIDDFDCSMTGPSMQSQSLDLSIGRILSMP